MAIGIRLIVGMSLWTMGLKWIDKPHVAASHVLGPADLLEVEGLGTMPNPAEMIQVI